LQYIGPSENDSHPQTSVEISQKGSHSESHSKKSNPKAENGVYKNFDAHLKYSYKQAHENIAIRNSTIRINKKNQPVEISLINDFITSATNAYSIRNELWQLNLICIIKLKCTLKPIPQKHTLLSSTKLLR
jgi:hypothetical protein